VFEELTALDPFQELPLGEEVVVLPVDLARPASAGRRRDRELEVRAASEQAFDQRALSRS